ncbi:MAG: pyruvate ferredoxin oxidoreductase [Actinobacteria bacterium]|nr:pyruvate ferredoxin oxidoreductase [Actinomycetota bacterium]
MRRILEGSQAVAESVAMCRPKVVCAYPITPQTHIVEGLARLVAEGRLDAQYVLVEAEFSAASVVLGASATGARAYTATSSQGLLLMTEVIFNIAGMRLPVVMTVANRAVSAPINIWNDQQDSMSLRDCGWIQMYAEDIQEACDMHIQAFTIAEELNIPVMVCMDGYILTHAMEPVEVPEQEHVDAYLPPFKPKFYLTPKDPITLGSMAGPDAYMEIRLLLHQSMQRASFTIREEANRFEEAFGRSYGDLLGSYRAEDAELLLVSMGSLLGTMKDAVDELRDGGHPVGIVKVRTVRPFPRTQLHDALADARIVGVIEKDISLGLEGILCSEIRSAFCGAARTPNISSFVVGLGGRDVTVDNIKDIALGLLSDDTCRVEVAGIDHEVLWSAHSEEE